MITRGKGLLFMKPCSRCGISFRRTSRLTKVCDNCVSIRALNQRRTILKKTKRIELL